MNARGRISMLFIAGLVFGGCVSASHSSTAGRLARELRGRELKIESRQVADTSRVFSNVGLLFYPSAISDYIFSLLVMRESRGAWPDDVKDRIDSYALRHRLLDEMMVLGVREPDGKDYDIVLDRGLMVSVRPEDQDAATRYVSALQGRKRADVFPVVSAR